MAVRRVKVMADYYAFPLWVSEEGGMPSSEELPLTGSLRDELDLWSADYTHILIANGYSWPSEQVRADLEQARLRSGDPRGAGAGAFLRGRVL
jgi:hypothetical protein